MAWRGRARRGAGAFGLRRRRSDAGSGIALAAPDPDLKASVYFNQGCLRWSCFRRPLSSELYRFGGWRWEVAPEKSEASSAGHDGGDARGRRTLLGGAVQIASFPSSLHPARMPGESPNPCRIERQRRSGRRHLLGGVVLGELGVDVMLWLLGGGLVFRSPAGLGGAVLHPTHGWRRISAAWRSGDSASDVWRWTRAGGRSCLVSW